MTTYLFSQNLISIVADLSRDIPDEIRYKRLLDAMQSIFPCDAAALLELDGNTLLPLAIEGLADDTMGRRFAVDQHPRLARLLHSREPVRFAADSNLPDPYDGLVETEDHHLHVHDCMGVSLYIDDEPWGVLTLDAMKTGTFDEIDPIELRTFIGLTEATVKAAQRIGALEARVIQERQLAVALIEGDSRVEMIGNSTALNRLKDEISIVSQSDLTVLIQGETGVGKELVARQIHTLSARADKPLVYVNCAALPESIAESELFGHIKGSFTGATSDRLGKFEVANSGTLFLDEIGELPLTIQAKMLRAIQSGEIQRVGSDQHIKVDVRILAATNRDLHLEVSKGRFRADLYHRLSVYPVKVPRLEERDNDSLLLSGYFLEKNQKRFGVQGLRLSLEAKQLIKQYAWPGNVRELEHVLSRAALKAINEQGRETRSILITQKHLDLSPDESTAGGVPKPIQRPINQEQISLKDATEQFQKEIITERLEKNHGNIAAAARELGINRSNLYRLLKRLDLLSNAASS
ncbi:MAG: nitric oxide reductase transcriptional regulator NorR [Pseudomonadales bacterium]|nr:nitric oxide reductase transcriptional regulator NorR [Pseudomonadales bacterium]MCP5213543.1 nitric oxide reductase transcriptional regulator NorR [Pseudomonadales bacterium]